MTWLLYRSSSRGKDYWTGIAWYVTFSLQSACRSSSASGRPCIQIGGPCKLNALPRICKRADQQCPGGGDEEHTCTQHSAVLDARATEGQARIVVPRSAHACEEGLDEESHPGSGRFVCSVCWCTPFLGIAGSLIQRSLREADWWTNCHVSR